MYSQAFDAQLAEGDRVLSLVAVAERKLAERRASTSRLNEPFDPNKAAYYVDGVDPPLTASLRASLKALKAYNEALVGLANGESAEAMTNKLGILTANTGGAFAAISSVAGGVPGVDGSVVFTAGLSKTLEALTPLFKEVAVLVGRETFRKRLVAAYPKMRDLLSTLRAGTPTLYLVMERARVIPGTETPSGLTAEGEAALRNERRMLAGWVLLIDQTLTAMEAAAVSAAAPMSASDLTALSEAAIELRVLAEKVRSLPTQ